jgi:hypothetical protein
MHVAERGLANRLLKNSSFISYRGGGDKSVQVKRLEQMSGSPVNCPKNRMHLATVSRFPYDKTSIHSAV